MRSDDRLRPYHLIHFIVIKTFSEPFYPVGGGIVILEEAPPIQIEMLHHRNKVIIRATLFHAFLQGE